VNPFKPLGGLKVATNPHLAKRVWEFPKDRFVTYEPTDEPWCRYFGFGREVTVYTAVQMGDTLFVHPAVLDQLQKEFGPKGKG
jgi:hypothetical protein